MVIAGSVGKKTSLSTSDVDFVLFINDEQPPFENVLTAFEVVLRKYYNIRHIHHTSHALIFDIGRFHFNLLIATNFVNSRYGCSGNEVRYNQQMATLNVMHANSNEMHLYTPGLAFSGVKFMARQHGFAHGIARIAKHWYRRH